jgi:hypothetical protein
MNENHLTIRQSSEFLAALCDELLRIALHEDELAFDEAADAPYWAPRPPSVVGHRAAARALRDDVVQLRAQVATLPAAS